uniref:Uncharacterized protein n=1 Tax=Solanum tuberosum TaxID=4113 RepID=M1DKX5_SOLTU
MWELSRTPFLFLKVVFICSQNFSIGFTRRSKLNFSDLVGDTPSDPFNHLLVLDFHHLCSVTLGDRDRPCRSIRCITEPSIYFTKLVLSMDWPARTLGELKVHSATHQVALSGDVIGSLEGSQTQINDRLQLSRVLCDSYKGAEVEVLFRLEVPDGSSVILSRNDDLIRAGQEGNPGAQLKGVEEVL